MEDRIDSPDVAEYVEFARDLSRYCIEHGIQRGSSINPWSVLVNSDKEKAARTSFGRWWRRGVVGPPGAGIGGGWLAFRLRKWYKSQRQLLTK
jgi:hypothetical protein